MMRRWKPFAVLFAFILVLFGWLRQGTAASNSRNSPQEQPRQNEQSGELSRVTLPTGTTISIRIADEVNSNHNHSGDLITGTVDPSVFIADHVVIPRGTEAHVRLTENRKGGRVHGKADVRLELVGLVMNQEKVDVDSDEYRKKQGALGAKVKGMAAPTASAGASAATSPTPGAGAVAPIIAVFRAAKIEVHAGTRIPFKLETPFTFDAPVVPPTGFESDRR